MSRFYDALQHASRSQHIGDVLAKPESATTPSTVAADVVAEVSPSSVRGELNAAVTTVVEPNADPWQISHEEERYSRRRGVRSNPIATTTNIFLDRAARLIPNAADTAIVEHYRRLRTKVVQQHEMKPFRTVVVTSASPREGKTVTTLNLAFSFAMLPSFRVVVIDGDLRRASLGKWLGITDRPGLSNLIDGTATLEDVVYKSEELPIHFIGSGTSTTPAGELLHSPQITNHFRAMAEQFDLVLIDSPPANLVTDAHLLASGCDAVLLVARAFSTTQKQLERLVQDLQTFRILGVVLNGSSKAHLYRRYGGYY
jgi:capsular exopolysaccharide synthesis family protein